jgi:PAS domain S-box-containing protein
VASSRWLHALALVLVVALAVPLALSGLVFVGQLRRGGPGAGWAVAGLACLAVALVAVAAGGRAILAALRQSARRAQVMATAAATSPDWVWGSDLDGRLTFSNKAVTDVLGYEPEQLVGTSVFDLLADDASRCRAREMLAESRRVASAWDDVELTWAHKGGWEVTLHGSGTPIRDRKGRAVGFGGSHRLVGEDRASRAVVALARQRVRAVLASRAVDMALQPIVDLTSGRVSGVEALARFHDGRSPDAWFADAQDAGRTHELDELTFNAALSLLEAIPDSAYLSINASPDLLTNAAFRERLTDSGLPLARVVIEITEHARVADYGDLNAALSPLRARGVRFAIDDTGAGYASLSHVLQLNPDIIKMDRALIANLNGDRARRSLVTALVLLALDIGASVTGEGVETETQKDTLTTLGVDQAQGYLLARPTTDRTVWQEWWNRSWVPESVVRAPGQRTTSR